jgi:transposase
MPNYPSNINKEQFKQIENILLSTRKITKPRTVDLHRVFNGLMYLLKSGCQWNMIPKEYPNYKTIFSYFKKWKETTNNKGETVLEQVLKKIGRTRTYDEWKRMQNYNVNN